MEKFYQGTYSLLKVGNQTNFCDFLEYRSFIKGFKMPRIDTDVKLDFKDVLFRPKRSTIRSRADVSTDCNIF